MRTVEQEDRKEALLQAVADDYSRRIIFSIVDRPKSVEEIAEEDAIPVSTCYRRIRRLLNLRLIRLEGIVVTDEGKKFETYRSVVKDAILSFSSSGNLSVEVDLTVREPDQRLAMVWNTVRKEAAKEDQPPQLKVVLG